MQFFLTSAVLNLSGLEKFRASLEEAMQQFIALSGTDSDPQSLEKKLALPDQGVTLPVSYDRNAPEKRRIGYARVSTVGQTLDSQLEQLRAAGCTAKIYREKVTGGRAQRPARASQNAEGHRPRRRGDGDTD